MNQSAVAKFLFLILILVALFSLNSFVLFQSFLRAIDKKLRAILQILFEKRFLFQWQK